MTFSLLLLFQSSNHLQDKFLPQNCKPDAELCARKFVTSWNTEGVPDLSIYLLFFVVVTYDILHLCWV